MKHSRGQRCAAFKAKAAPAAPDSGQTPAQSAERFVEHPTRHADHRRRGRATGQMQRQPWSIVSISRTPSDLAIFQPPQSAILYSRFFERTLDAPQMYSTACRHALNLEFRQAAHLPIHEPIA